MTQRQNVLLNVGRTSIDINIERRNLERQPHLFVIQVNSSSQQNQGRTNQAWERATTTCLSATHPYLGGVH